MPTFEIDWRMEGTATIEADEEDEARDLLHQGLGNLDSQSFNYIDVEDVDVLSCTEVDD